MSFEEHRGEGSLDRKMVRRVGGGGRNFWDYLYAYSQYCSLSVPMVRTGGEFISQPKSFSVGHYLLHSREINLLGDNYNLLPAGWGGVGDWRILVVSQ